MDTLTLHEEYRFIEKNDVEVNGVWKGAHLLLFFLAFVFGSFCTFCFHMLMYLFDEKCVLFPKLLSLTSFRQNIIYEFIPDNKEAADMLPVDFLSTQWVEKSACLLPTYVPLVSGIFGLVWTTMFLMCSTGSRVLTGLERPWRVLPSVFLFSLAMSGLCVYTTAVTHYGLQELCLKLSEITGSSTCTYTINVATLAYERRIRGVYQATRLTILSAWLHTSCWLLSALLAVIRVVLAVDFQLVKVTVQLRGNIDRMLEQHEKHICTVSAETSEANRQSTPVQYSRSRVHIHFKKKKFQSNFSGNKINTAVSTRDDGDLLYYSGLSDQKSEPSLVAIERDKLDRNIAYSTVDKEHRFIVDMLYNLIETVGWSSDISSFSSEGSSDSPEIARQYGQQRITSNVKQGYQESDQENMHLDINEAEKIALEIKRNVQTQLHNQPSESKVINYALPKNPSYVSTLNIVSDMKIAKEEKRVSLEISPDDNDNKPGPSNVDKNELKSNLKSTGAGNKEKEKTLKVQIDSTVYDDEQFKKDKETQTNKEKQE